MIVIVTGERDWKDRETIYRVLDEELALFLDPDWFPERAPGIFDFAQYDAAARARFVLRHGVAEGADWIANDWAKERGVTVERYPAQWKDPVTGQYDLSAGPRRNRDMAKKQPPANKVLAFWSGKMRVKFGKREYSGTLDMIQAGLAEGIPVRVEPPAKIATP